MIVYMDTSSLVKLYIEEEYSRDVRIWAEEAEIIATSRIAYPEILSALNRRFRKGDISRRVLNVLIDGFTREWNDFVIIDFDEIEAGRLASKYALRGLDAIHLSSLKILSSANKNLDLCFTSFDKRLNEAVSKEGFRVLSARGV